ncbi:MAG: ferredoxin [Acidimicrobiales bacterium]
MRIIVDRLQCEANGMCEELVPGVFSLDDNDELQLLTTEVPDGVADDVEAAVHACPKQALSLEPS